MTDNIPLFEIAWDGDDVQNVVDSVTRGGFWANGPYVDEFEERLETYLGVEHAVVFNSGTTALASALRAHGVGDGDEVIVPSFTFISTANAARLVDAEPVFVDIEAERYGLDPDAVEAAITENTAAIVPVHYAGNPCRIEEITRIADKHGVPVVEDAAEAFGARHDDQLVGTFGDSGMYSFCQNKVITTGEGGAIVTDDEELASTLRLLRSHGRASGDYFSDAAAGEYVQLGNNFRMPDVVAAIGSAQMEKVEDIIARRRRVAGRLSEGLETVDGVTPPPDPRDSRHVYQLYTVTFDDWVDRDGVIDFLSDRGVASKVYFHPAHRSQYYEQTRHQLGSEMTTTNRVSGQVLSLPMSPNQDIEVTDRIVTAVSAAIEAQRV